MQLTGDLSDFALTDILQILALSRKTGMVLLEGSGWQGKIVVQNGRITEAWADPGDTLADSLALAGLLSADAARAHNADVHRSDMQLEALLVGRGILTRNGLTAAARRHTQRVIAQLVRLEKGRFSIALGEATLPRSIGSLRLSEGLDVGEALLFAAHEQDESYKERDFQRVTDEEDPGMSLNSGRDTQPLADRSGRRAPQRGEPDDYEEPNEFHDRSALLCSLLAEMRQHSFEAEVSLMMMRYASELVSRGILFAIKDSKLCGLGQFGLGHSKDGKSADEMVRELCLPLDGDSVFGRVVRTGRAVRRRDARQLLVRGAADSGRRVWARAAIVCASADV